MDKKISKVDWWIMAGLYWLALGVAIVLYGFTIGDGLPGVIMGVIEVLFGWGLIKHSKLVLWLLSIVVFLDLLNLVRSLSYSFDSVMTVLQFSATLVGAFVLGMIWKQERVKQ